MYVLVVTLSKENDTTLLEQLKTEFKRTIKWNKYRSQITVQSNNNNLNYLIDTTFTNLNILSVLSFTRTNASDNRDSFSDYYAPKVEIKDFYVLIDGKFSLFCQYKIIEMSNNNDYLIGNLLDFVYFKEHYKLTAIDLSNQTKLKDMQQINFIGNLEANGATMFFIIEKSEETTFDFSQTSATII